MSRNFSMVAPQLWRSGRFRELVDDGPRLLYFYLLTSPHQNCIGCYRLPRAYACNDLGWEPPQFDEAIDAVAAVDLAQVDGQTEEILICRWFRHNDPTNEKHLLGVQRLIGKIESDTLRARAVAELDAAMEEANAKWWRAHRSAPDNVTEIFGASMGRPAERAFGGRR